MGPLDGLRILELEAIGPAPFGCMMLADMGADVLRIDRAEAPQLGLELDRAHDLMLRGRRSVTLDLKTADGVAAALRLVEHADALVEGFRPGVLERLGLGPEVLQARNPRLVVGRMTGWGQDGPLASEAGHDINYIALSGALHAIGRKDQPPVPPLNLVGDFGGGGMLLAFGVVCALLEAQRSGRGQVVDAAMAEGAALLSTMFAGMRAAQRWSDARGDNILDSGAPWYDVYATADGGYMAVGAIEPRFYRTLLDRLGLADARLPLQHDRAGWPQLREALERVFRTRSREEWTRLFAGSDACVTPVLSFAEAPLHPHAKARAGYVDVGGIVQPAPAPRYSRTPGSVGDPPPARGQHGAQALADWGFTGADIAQLRLLGLGISS